MPLLIYRDFITNKGDVDHFKNFYELWKKNISNKDFSIEEYAKATFLNVKIPYITEILKQACHSSKTIISVVPNFWCNELKSQWKDKVNEEYIKLTDFLKYKNTKSETRSERIEKHIITELMLGTFITEFYILNEVFPYNYKMLRLNYGNDIKLWKNCFNTYREIK